MPTLTYSSRRSGRLTRRGRQEALQAMASLRREAEAAIATCDRTLGWRALTAEELTLWNGAQQTLHSLKLEEAYVKRHGMLPKPLELPTGKRQPQRVE
jgi:hypothetical protein